MDYKKTLGIISIFVIVMFVLMLSSSYAWYSFANGSTTFSAVTNNKDIKVIYRNNAYISTLTAVPISSDEVADKADKNMFSIEVNNDTIEEQILVSIGLVDVNIDSELKNNNFKYDLLYNGTSIASGNFSGVTGDTFNILDSVALDNLSDNDFELRVYLLDDGTNQNSLMNKTFRGTISVNVISRLKTTLENQGIDILVSSITIDGVSSDSLPNSGRYTMSANCNKGSRLRWEPVTRTITYASGSKVNDSCALTFTKDTNYPTLVSIAKAGDYVSYSGNNGCTGKACQGQNANYVSDTDMGYCFNSNSKFNVNGWRVGYISDGTAYLVSAGAPECVASYIESVSSSTISINLSANYYYGSGYYLNPATGYFELRGVTSSTVAWSSNYDSIISDTPYTCESSTKPVKGTTTGACTTLYKIDSYSSDTKGLAYKYTRHFDSTNGAPVHLANLNSEALKYCNSDYAYGGSCNEGNSWAMNANDFENITGTNLTGCRESFSNMSCGYNNSLTDNGGYYWYAKPFDSSSSKHVLYWYPDARSVYTDLSSSSYGVRPVLRLQSSVWVVGGSGTYEDPYIINNS